jgi:hypothetical protein
MARFLTGLVACVVCLTACGPSPTPSIIVPPSVTAPTASPTLSPTPAPTAATGWTMLRAEPGADGVHLYDVATFRGAFIAIGSTDLAAGVAIGPRLRWRRRIVGHGLT